MLRKIFSILTFLHLTTLSQVVVAQDLYEKQANRLFEEQVYPEAANLYTLLLQENYKYEYNLKLAECYANMNMPIDAEYWYAQLATQEPLTNPEILLSYAHLLKKNGKYVSAKEVFLRYAQHNADGFYLAGTCDYAINNKNNKTNFVIDSLSINSSQSDIAAAFFDEGILFSSNRSEETQDLIFYDLYYAKDVSVNNVLKLGKSINTPVHEATVAYDINRNELYFTRNNFSKGRSVTSKDDQIKLKIFSAKYNAGKWKPVSEFAYNSKKYSCGQPCISTDGTILLFVSDMPGGFGGTDIYYCTRSGKEWGKPVNLGEIINTKGNEMFPFLSEDGKLFFASDWLPGFGGMDIFISDRGTGNWKKPNNLGLPVNSARDDYAFIINNGTGYFSSNRPGGKGDDDIYSFIIMNAVTGVFVTDDDNVPLINASVSISDGNSSLNLGKTNEDGMLQFQFDETKNYTLEVSYAGFRKYTLTNLKDIKTSNGILPVQMLPLIGYQEQVPEEPIDIPVKIDSDIVSTETQKSTTDVITYELQIGVFKNPDYGKISSLTTFGELSVKSKEGGTLSFSIINIPSLETVEQAKASAISNGFKDAYIITYKNGIKQ